MKCASHFIQCYQLESCSGDANALKTLACRVVGVHVDLIWPMAYIDAALNVLDVHRALYKQRAVLYDRGGV